MEHTPTSHKYFNQLCEEIDAWKEEALFWKEKYETAHAEQMKDLDERLEESKRGVANALMFCLSVNDNPDGSLSISKEDRELLSNQYKK